MHLLLHRLGRNEMHPLSDRLCRWVLIFIPGMKNHPRMYKVIHKSMILKLSNWPPRKCNICEFSDLCLCRNTSFQGWTCYYFIFACIYLIINNTDKTVHFIFIPINNHISNENNTNLKWYSCIRVCSEHIFRETVFHNIGFTPLGNLSISTIVFWKARIYGLIDQPMLRKAVPNNFWCIVFSVMHSRSSVIRKRIHYSVKLCLT